MPEEIKRMKYFDGLFLKADEFNLEQNYHIRMRRLHNRRFHSWGIVWGLEVTANGTAQVNVSKGMALNIAFEDGEEVSQEIVLPEDITVDLNTPPSGETSGYIYISYSKKKTDRVPDKGGDEEIHWVERPDIIFFPSENSEKPAPPEEKILLAKVTIDSDGNITTSDQEDGNSLRTDAGFHVPDLKVKKLTLDIEGAGTDLPLPFIEGKSFDGQNGILVNSPHTQLTGPITMDDDLNVRGTQVTIDGKVGIGTPSPGGSLDVGGGKLVVLEDGKAGIGKLNPEVELDIDGDIQTSGDIILSGDIKLKTGDEPISLRDQLDRLESLVNRPRITDLVCADTLLPGDPITIKGLNFVSQTEPPCAPIVRFLRVADNVEIVAYSVTITNQIQLEVNVPDNVDVATQSAAGIWEVTVEVDERVSSPVNILIQPS